MGAFFSNIVAKASGLKLSLSQYVISSMALVIAGLAAVLKFKERELSQARASLLSQKFQNEQQLQDQAIAKANERVTNAKAQLDEAFSRISNTK